MNLARGCDLACTYCPYVTATGRRMIVRPPAAVAAEFERQVARHRPKRVVFRDPVFGRAREESLDLLGRLAVLGAATPTPIEVETRPELLDHALAQKLARAGCVEIKLGIETIEEAALLASRRVPDAAAAARYPEAVGEALASARGAGIPVRAFVMSGLARATAEGDAALDAHLPGPVILVRKARLPPDPVALADMMARGH